MRRIILLITAATLMAAMLTVVSVPAFAAPPAFSTDPVDYVTDISIQWAQEVYTVWCSFNLSYACVDFIRAVDLPSHTSDTSDEFQAPVWLF